MEGYFNQPPGWYEDSRYSWMDDEEGEDYGASYDPTHPFLDGGMEPDFDDFDDFGSYGPYYAADMDYGDPYGDWYAPRPPYGSSDFRIGDSDEDGMFACISCGKDVLV